MIRNKSFNNGPILYLLATPIGNLKDVSFRLIETLTDCDLVACEDTRNTGFLLNKLNINKPLISLHEHNESSQSDEIINKILNDSLKVCYASDAGYPIISDPGHILVKKCLENGINISIIPGPSAFLSALVGSNIDASHFLFYGFLNAKETQAKKELENLRCFPYSLIFYESPHRIEKTLKLLYKVLGNRVATIVREITKINEEYIYATLEEFSKMDFKTLKGELVIIVEKYYKNEEIIIDETKIKNELNKLLKDGINKSEACQLIITKYKINKKLVYKLISEIEK